MTAKELKEFIKSCKHEAEDFKFGNKVLMAIIHVCLTNIKKDGRNAKGATSKEVLEALNNFKIEDKDFDTKKKIYTESDMLEISIQVFALAANNLVNLDPSDIEHVKPTTMGTSVGAINFNVIKPLQHSVVYEFNAEIENDIKRQQTLMNN